jgi:response regulator RpfG family c-di-GMP phosphodiesterase
LQEKEHSADDKLIFRDERPETSESDELLPAPLGNWKILIVDDDKEVHAITTLVLKKFQYDNRGLDFFHAYSAREARNILKEQPDIAVILLDVVMETKDAGLLLVDYIRNNLKNKFVRIILRTGQPGEAPEERIIIEYDINDYKEKTELSSQKLVTVMLSSLRTYRDIQTIEASRRGLQRIIEASSSLFEQRSLKQLASGVLTQLVSILHMHPDALVCETSGCAFTDTHNTFEILATTGRYDSLIDAISLQQLPEQIRTDICEASDKQKCLCYDDRYIGYFPSDSGRQVFIFCEGLGWLDDLNRALIEIFCSNVHIAFQNIDLNSEIEASQKEMIFTLGEVAEARSQETGWHVKRVSEYARLLGEQYGLSPKQVEILRMASPMHDVGKVAIPDAILKHPGQLNDNDFQIMMTHATIGETMLNSSNRPIMQAAALISRQHHEKYDGSGYPDGLKGEEIDIFARITAIADVFDALASDRVYRKACAMPKILDYFKEQRGKHFDPELLDLFLENITAFQKIQNKFSEGMAIQ